MDNWNLDTPRASYKQTVDAWVNAIRAQEALAIENHSEVVWEEWDATGLSEEDLRTKVDEARDVYEDALREANLRF